MQHVIELPEGHRAILRDPADLRERGRRLIQTAMVPLTPVFARLPRDLIDAAAKGDEDARQAAENLMGAAIKTRAEAAATSELRDAVIVALLLSWTRPEPLPTMETIQDMDPALYAALDKGTREWTPGAMKTSLPTSFEPVPNTEEFSDRPFDSSANSVSTSNPTAPEGPSPPSLPPTTAAIAIEASTRA